MGSPVSLVVANLVVEDVEKRAIENFSHPPKIWLRYVDDAFVIIEQKIGSNTKVRRTHACSTDFGQHVDARGVLTQTGVPEWTPAGVSMF